MGKHLNLKSLTLFIILLTISIPASLITQKNTNGDDMSISHLRNFEINTEWTQPEFKTIIENSQNKERQKGFKENKGQFGNSAVKFYMESPENVFFFKSSEISISYVDKTSYQTELISIMFSGSNNVEPVGRRALSGYSNYFISGSVITNVFEYEEIWYFDIYSGIDLRYILTKEGLKYEFIVHPEADPNDILIQMSDSIQLEILEGEIYGYSAKSGQCVYHENGLKVFQDNLREVETQFIKSRGLSNSFGFGINQYDSKKELTIDPIIKINEYTFGGDQVDAGKGIFVDSDGFIYITGGTNSYPNFPIVNAYEPIWQGDYDAFVTKLEPDGTSILFSTYLGGNDFDIGYGIGVDTNGNVYISGETDSDNFPVFNQYQNNQLYKDIFITGLNSTGNGLLYSTYLGSSGSSDEFRNFKVDENGNAYFYGQTASQSFPVKNAIQSVKGDPGVMDCVIAKFESDGNCIFCTYLGGDHWDTPSELVLDAYNNIYISGVTDSSNFPVVNEYQAPQGGFDLFVAKIDTNGTNLIFSTCIGGTGDECDNYDSVGLALDSAGNCYITGYTDYIDYPTLNPYQTFQGGKDAVITKLNSTGNGLIFSTYLGNSTTDETAEIVFLDELNNLYIVGMFGTDYVICLNSTGNGIITSIDDNLIHAMINGGYYIKQDHLFITSVIDDDVLILEYIFDQISPMISNSGNIQFNEGETGNIITWNLYDKYPGNYTLKRNGIEEITGTWINGTPIIVVLDGLSAGTFIYEIEAYDQYLNLATSQVIVEVYDTTAPTVNLLTILNNTEQPDGTIISFDIIDFSGIAQVLYRWDSNNFTTKTSPFDFLIPSEHSEHILQINAQDNLGYWTNKTYVFTTVLLVEEYSWISFSILSTSVIVIFHIKIKKRFNDW
ncbi:MAG: hypothetical protein GPJ51_11235 [Candidatus Heimdallarchaeota archaeon]|nr:hypothetical protein [Candidatus Heimdallarchaeota archaeon]